MAPGPDDISRGEIRAIELANLLDRLPAGSRLLEIGAGSGYQASLIAAAGHQVEAVDLHLWGKRVFEVKPYDGVNLPFETASFDAVFSSNVLEHVVRLDELEAEIARVLKPDGFALHVIPTHWWRLWNSVTYYPALPKIIRGALGHLRQEKATPDAVDPAQPKPQAADENGSQAATPPRPRWRRWLKWLGTLAASPRHGERGNRFSEFFYFHPRWWRRHFTANGFTLTTDYPAGIYYSGNYLLGPRLALRTRQRLSKLLGSSTHVYVMEKGREG
jgi:SAM-dependent methyltransferase